MAYVGFQGCKCTFSKWQVRREPKILFISMTNGWRSKSSSSWCWYIVGWVRTMASSQVKIWTNYWWSPYCWKEIRHSPPPCQTQFNISVGFFSRKKCLFTLNDVFLLCQTNSLFQQAASTLGWLAGPCPDLKSRDCAFSDWGEWGPEPWRTFDAQGGPFFFSPVGKMLITGVTVMLIKKTVMRSFSHQWNL